MALASGILDTGVTWEIKDKLAMLLEHCKPCAAASQPSSASRASTCSLYAVAACEKKFSPGNSGKLATSLDVIEGRPRDLQPSG